MKYRAAPISIANGLNRFRLSVSHRFLYVFVPPNAPIGQVELGVGEDPFTMLPGGWHKFRFANAVGDVFFTYAATDGVELHIFATDVIDYRFAAVGSGVIVAPNAPPLPVPAPTPVSATRFVIVDPADTVTDVATTVTVRAEDALGNLVVTEQRDVTLVASGSATGGGLVDIVNGVGSLNITDAVAETVTLSLSDTQGTGLDVTSTQDLIVSAVGVKPARITEAFIGSLGGTVWYVDGVGSGAADGTSWGDAWAEFGPTEQAAASLTANDAVFFADGVYTLPAGATSIIPHVNVATASAGDRIYYVSLNELGAQLDGETTGTLDGVDHIVSADGADGLYLDGFEIFDGFGSGVRLADTDYCDVYYCHIHDMQTSGSGTGGGIQVFNATHCNIKWNTIVDCRTVSGTPSNVAGIILGSGGGLNVKIMYNVIRLTGSVTNDARGLYFKQDLEFAVEVAYNAIFGFVFTSIGSSGNDTAGHEIHHNIIHSTRGGPVTLFGDGTETVAGAVSFHHNTLLVNKGWTLEFKNGASASDPFHLNGNIIVDLSASGITLILWPDISLANYNANIPDAMGSMDNNTWYRSSGGNPTLTLARNQSGHQTGVTGTHAGLTNWQTAVNTNGGFGWSVNDLQEDPEIVDATEGLDGDYRSKYSDRGAYAAGSLLPLDLTELGSFS